MSASTARLGFRHLCPQPPPGEFGLGAPGRGGGAVVFGWGAGLGRLGWKRPRGEAQPHFFLWQPGGLATPVSLGWVPGGWAEAVGQLYGPAGAGTGADLESQSQLFGRRGGLFSDSVNGLSVQAREPRSVSWKLNFLIFNLAASLPPHTPPPQALAYYTCLFRAGSCAVLSVGGVGPPALVPAPVMPGQPHLGLQAGETSGCSGGWLCLDPEGPGPFSLSIQMRLGGARGVF